MNGKWRKVFIYQFISFMGGEKQMESKLIRKINKRRQSEKEREKQMESKAKLNMEAWNMEQVRNWIRFWCVRRNEKNEMGGLGEQ